MESLNEKKLLKVWSTLKTKKEKMRFLFKNPLKLEDIPKDILDEIMADVDLRLALLDGYDFKDNDVEFLAEYIVKGQIGDYLSSQILSSKISDEAKAEFKVLLLLRSRNASTD